MYKKKTRPAEFVMAFRQAAPYINAHRGKTFVVAFSGNAVDDPSFAQLVQDIALLNSLGVRLVIVHGARPQIEKCLRQRGADSHYVNGIRVTDEEALDCTCDAVGSIRVDIEALFSTGLPNTPMAGAGIQVVSGNFLTARPYGIHDGIDYGYTGTIRKVDRAALLQYLQAGSTVMLSPLAYSVTGEVFNVNSEEVATYTASAIGADKLIFLLDGDGLKDSGRRPLRQLTRNDAEQLLSSRRKLDNELMVHLRSAVQASRAGIDRVHLVPGWTHGSLLQELYTRDGVGTLITASGYEKTRPARVDDIGGIIELIEPLEQQGLLVKRSREQLEMDIGNFFVSDRDGLITACAALIPYVEDEMGEMVCLAVHEDYRNAGRGDSLLQDAEARARETGLKAIFVLTTQASHWFRERGFEVLPIEHLPIKKRQLYNYQRKSRVYIKYLDH
jgi:amino-acid N-acetyltransferase